MKEDRNIEDHYKTLGIPRDADNKTIKDAYKKLALKYHPDRPTKNIEKFKEIGKAYGVLMDPITREQHDKSLILSDQSFKVQGSQYDQASGLNSSKQDAQIGRQEKELLTDIESKIKGIKSYELKKIKPFKETLGSADEERALNHAESTYNAWFRIKKGEIDSLIKNLRDEESLLEEAKVKSDLYGDSILSTLKGSESRLRSIDTAAEGIYKKFEDLKGEIRKYERKLTEKFKPLDHELSRKASECRNEFNKFIEVREGIKLTLDGLSKKAMPEQGPYRDEIKEFNARLASTIYQEDKKLKALNDKNNFMHMLRRNDLYTMESQQNRIQDYHMMIATCKSNIGQLEAIKETLDKDNVIFTKERENILAKIKENQSMQRRESPEFGNFVNPQAQRRFDSGVNDTLPHRTRTHRRPK